MLELIILELKIFFRKKKNIIAILAFSGLLIFLINVSNSLEKQKINGELEIVKDEIESVDRAIESLNDQYKSTKNQDMLSSIEDCKRDKDICENKKQAILNEDASKVLEADIKEDEILIKGIKDGTMYGESSDVVEERLNKNKYMFDNNIIPIYDVTMTSYNFLIDIGKEILPLFLIILMFLFNGDITSKDSEMGTYKILLIQPMKRVKILYSKIIASIIASMIMILGTLSIFFISLGFIKGLGSSNYPMSFYDVSSDEIINIGIAKFCGYFVILLIFLMIFYVSLSTLISIISNNSTTSIGVSITLGISIFILNTQYKIAPKIAHLNPFTYMNIPNILNGTILKQFENTNINYKYCLGVIVFFTILNIVISTFIFKKRDVIC